ncbi:Syntaxin-16 [Hypsibius exemplaris]|uniref:Syntaxin-16 n=1 Tax=Hypsibius exemplaris TaxID=2072580 RepID=A0A1W0WYG9_HYPEX|nr:Syntaxin-16 [Hypsibius exemplaris]
MTSRNLTDIFHLMRNNAIQRLHIFSDHTSNKEEDKVSLVPRNTKQGRKGFDVDLERGDGDGDESAAYNRISASPPEWVNALPEFREQIELLRQKIKELNVFHERHLTRPTLLFDDNDKSQEEERIIERLSDDLTRKLHQLQRQAENFRKRSQLSSSKQEDRLKKNVILSMVSELQEVTTEFRQSQSAYLSRIRHREQQSEMYFGNSLMKQDSLPLLTPEQQQRQYSPENEDGDEVTVFQRGGMGLTSQLQLQEEDIEMARNRERQVTEVVKSITELNEIFNDLSVMVVEQGAVVDRIDYNVDRAAEQASSGLQQLQKAETYQRKSRKFMCVVGLTVAILVLTVLLIIVKS